MFKIIKKTSVVWWHEYNGSVRHISNFVVISDIEAQTFFIRAISGASFPLEAVNVSDIAVIDETDSSTIETFANITDLLNRLVALQYTPYKTSGGGGGAVDSVNGQVGTVVLDADDIDDSATAHKFVTASEKTAITHSNRTTLDAITEAFTTALKTAYDSASSWIITNGTNVLNHIASTSNPHNVTKTQVGLSNVPNTDATNPANITQSSSYRFVTDTEKNTWNGKQNALGFTPEDSANKSTSTSDSASTTKFPVWSAIVSYFSASQIRSILGISTLSGSNTGDETNASIISKIGYTPAPNFYSLKVTTPSSYVTGTLSEAEVLRVEIPANTFSASDVIKLNRALSTKIGTNGTATIRVKLSASSTMPSGTTDVVATQITSAANILYAPITRTFFVNSGVIKGLNFTGVTQGDDNLQSTGAFSSKAFDVTITNYLYISITLANINDQVRLEGAQITNY